MSKQIIDEKFDMSSRTISELKILDPKKGPRAFNAALSTLGGKPSGWRLAVFCQLKAYRNAENRAWPAVETIASELGCSKNTVTKCIKDLADVGAIVEVDFDKRSEQQAHLSNAKKVWQLTGKAIINGIEYWYWPNSNFPLTGNLISHSVIKQLSGNKELNIIDSSEEKEKEESKESLPVQAPGKVTDDDQYLLLQDPLDRLDSLRNQVKGIKEPDQRRNYKGYTKHPFYQGIELVYAYGCAVEGKPFGGYGLGTLCKWFHNEALGRDEKPAHLSDLIDFMVWYIGETTSPKNPHGYNMPRERSRMVHWWGKWKRTFATVADEVDLEHEAAMDAWFESQAGAA